MKKIAIIGAGPAGIFSALFLKDFLGEVHLFEQNADIGEKLKITGGGRMNITNKEFSAKQFSSEQDNLLKNIFKSPFVKQREDLMKELGIEYEWENNRAILKSGNAALEVSRLFEELHKQDNFQLHLNTRVHTVEPKESQFLVNNKLFDFVIISSGGMFRLFDQNSTGNKQMIYHLSQGLGHRITPVRPSLSGIILKDNPFVDLSGVSIPAALKQSKKVEFSGDLLFTHQGISGPVVLDFSSTAAEAAELNFLVNENEAEITQTLEGLRNGKHRILQFLQRYLPKRVAEWHLDVLGIDHKLFVSDLAKKQEIKLLQNLFHFPLQNIAYPSFSHAWTTKGGVDLRSIHAHNLESKLHNNLFFAGELLDVNGLCGGFNISFAMISAKTVAQALLQK